MYSETTKNPFTLMPHIPVHALKHNLPKNSWKSKIQMFPDRDSHMIVSPPNFFSKRKGEHNSQN